MLSPLPTPAEILKRSHPFPVLPRYPTPSSALKLPRVAVPALPLLSPSECVDKMAVAPLEGCLCSRHAQLRATGRDLGGQERGDCPMVSGRLMGAADSPGCRRTQHNRPLVADRGEKAAQETPKICSKELVTPAQC